MTAINVDKLTDEQISEKLSALSDERLNAVISKLKSQDYKRIQKQVEKRMWRDFFSDAESSIID